MNFLICRTTQSLTSRPLLVSVRVWTSYSSQAWTGTVQLKSIDRHPVWTGQAFPSQRVLCPPFKNTAPCSIQSSFQLQPSIKQANTQRPGLICPRAKIFTFACSLILHWAPKKSYTGLTHIPVRQIKGEKIMGIMWGLWLDYWNKDKLLN